MRRAAAGGGRRGPARLLGGLSRFVVFLNWALLVAVFGFVVYLIVAVKPH